MASPRSRSSTPPLAAGLATRSCGARSCYTLLPHTARIFLPLRHSNCARPPPGSTRCARRASGEPPPPFDGLVAWATNEMGRWGGGASNACRVRRWQYVRYSPPTGPPQPHIAKPSLCASPRYVRSEHPCERLLHLTAGGTRWCFHRGRQHKSQLVMLTIDLLGGRAWQVRRDRLCQSNAHDQPSLMELHGSSLRHSPPPWLGPSTSGWQPTDCPLNLARGPGP